ncbi:MAG: hypothetical protein GY797_31860 [Deltaproteobacteria bacterium]|nr:hypothetical protein [Deltaproteobacteria bacterium]
MKITILFLSIIFILGHALYRKAIHGIKAKNDKTDSHKIAGPVRGGTFPMAFVYKRHMRSTGDFLRRRMHLMRKRAELLCHIHNTNTQYNYDRPVKNLRYKNNRKRVDGRFADRSAQESMDTDIRLINFCDEQPAGIKWHIKKLLRLAPQGHFLRGVYGTFYDAIKVRCC